MKRTDSEAAVTIADAVTLFGCRGLATDDKQPCAVVAGGSLEHWSGKQIYRFDGGGKSGSGQSSAGWLWTILAAVAFGWLLFGLTADLVLTTLGILLVLVIGICLIFELGTPHFLHCYSHRSEVHRGHDDGVRPTLFLCSGRGFCDYLGVQPATKACKLIVVSDAGANAGGDHLGTLASMCEQAQCEMACVSGLGPRSPYRFRTFEQQDDQRLVHQPYLCMRVRYPNNVDGLLVYCQMAITEHDPIEIRQIRTSFPLFRMSQRPTSSTPTTRSQRIERWVTTLQRACVASWNVGLHASTNPTDSRSVQFNCNTSAKCSSQSSANRQPGSRHGALVRLRVNIRRQPRSRCSLAGRTFKSALQCQSIHNQRYRAQQVPYFHVVRERLLTAYRLACLKRSALAKTNVYSEAIWPQSSFAFPSFCGHANRIFG